MPKSMTLICSSPSPALVNKMFSKDRSRWAMPMLCSHLTASKICLAIGRSSFSFSLLGLASLLHHVKRSPSVASETATYVNSESLNTSCRSHAYGNSSLLRYRTMPISSHGRSVAVGYCSANSRCERVTHLFGIFLTATILPLSSRFIKSTLPWLRIASCRSCTNSRFAVSHGFTSISSSNMLFSDSTLTCECFSSAPEELVLRRPGELCSLSPAPFVHELGSALKNIIGNFMDMPTAKRVGAVEQGIGRA
mmetsp:Transcript_66927/g.160274  ORF Transcript_66927/g.160274 Transcript_66927/m.160274 type:complete len:251 (+) Transcript_66927:614-1366(+)